MAKLTTDELIEQFKELTLMELSELVKKFEETFEVTAAAPVAVAAAGPAVVTPPRSRSRPSSTSSSPAQARRRSASSRRCVASRASGSRKPRSSSRAHLKAVLEGVAKDAAEEAKDKLEAAGATVELK
jgi:large subunit ribosomal protein L7/L12